MIFFLFEIGNNIDFVVKLLWRKDVLIFINQLFSLILILNLKVLFNTFLHYFLQRLNIEWFIFVSIKIKKVWPTDAIHVIFGLNVKNPFTQKRMCVNLSILGVSNR